MLMLVVAAVLFIMNHALMGDITVTQDIRFASASLPIGVQLISPRVNLFEGAGFLTALDCTVLFAKARKRGVYSKGPKLFSPGDCQNSLSN